MSKKRGKSYKMRVAEINRIYDLYAKRGIPNREIWRKFIYPVYGICERTLYNLLKAPAKPDFNPPNEPSLFPDLDDQ